MRRVRRFAVWVAKAAGTTLLGAAVIVGALPGPSSAQGTKSWTGARPAKVETHSPLSRPLSGPLHIMVSLAEQRVTVYADGVAVGSSRISSGQSGYDTPTGVFSILEKQRYHESNIYSGAPMPFMQRLTWSGIALHEGHVPNYRASHGCIRLPAAFAHEMFSITKRGDRVIVSDRPLAPQSIEHPLLFVARPLPAEEQVALDIAEDDMREPDTKSPSRNAPISILISRKEGRVFVRRGFQQLFDADVTITDPGRYIGTHVFMAMGPTADGAGTRWTVVTTTPAHQEARRVATPRKQQLVSMGSAAPAAAPPPPATAHDALDRIELPSDVSGAISRWLTTGASLIITDQGLGSETSRELGTDFIVLGP